MTKEERYSHIIEWFKENMPAPESELKHHTPFELLVAVILSAQCTDKMVNRVTPRLFEALPDAQAMALSSPEVIVELIKGVTYPNNKAKALHIMANQILVDFDGEIPSEIEDLMKLQGVGRKTANVVASIVYDKPAMAVDTHVFRISHRLGLVKDAKTPYEVEKQLVKNIPEELIGRAHHWLILHGRYVCTARKPKCEQCGLRDWCVTYEKDSKKLTSIAQRPSKKKTVTSSKKRKDVN